MNTCATIRRTGHILRRGGAPPPVASKTNNQAADKELCRCPASAACITAMTRPPDSALQSTLKSLRMTDGRWVPPGAELFPSPRFSLYPEVTEAPPPSQNCCHGRRRVREAGSFCNRMAFWRSTGVLGTMPSRQQLTKPRSGGGLHLLHRSAPLTRRTVA